MAKPPAQGVARRNLLQPCVECKRVFRHTPWPQPIDQDTMAISASCRDVGSLNEHGARSNRRPAAKAMGALRYGSCHRTIPANDELSRDTPNRALDRT
jgi:hypothetical protein